MNHKKILYLPFTLLLSINLSCKKNSEANNELKDISIESKKSEVEIENTTKTELKPAKKPINFNIRTITTSEKGKYKNNLEIVNGESTYDNSQKLINLKIPVSNGNFQFHKMVDISSNSISALLYIITDNERYEILQKSMTHIIEDNFSTSILNGGIVKNNKLYVFTLNDHPEDLQGYETDLINKFRDSVKSGNISIECKVINITGFKDVKPKEACGGVLVGD